MLDVFTSTHIRFSSQSKERPHRMNDYARALVFLLHIPISRYQQLYTKKRGLSVRSFFLSGFDFSFVLFLVFFETPRLRSKKKSV